MKPRLLLTAIASTVAAFGSASAQSDSPDAQAQAAALLSRPPVSGIVQASERQYALPSSKAMDAHASAAAFLSGGTPVSPVLQVTPSAVASIALDAHAHAAALLKGSHITVYEDSRSTRASEALDEHPAVLVAQTWSTRAIDPNTFIVAHPAGLQLLAVSPNESQPHTAERVADVRTAKLSSAPAD